MSKCGVCLVALLATLLMANVIRAQEGAEDKEEETAEHYPTSFLQVDFKPIVDNERLFKKYKQCLLSDKTAGCPRDVLQLKKLVPEVIETECAKCLPEHVTKFKEAVEYICQKRREDYEEVRHARDPTGELQKKFEAKFGGVNC